MLTKLEYNHPAEHYLCIKLGILCPTVVSLHEKMALNDLEGGRCQLVLFFLLLNIHSARERCIIRTLPIASLRNTIHFT